MIEEEEIVGSTTLKTIRNLKKRQSMKPDETTTENESHVSLESQNNFQQSEKHNIKSQPRTQELKQQTTFNLKEDQIVLRPNSGVKLKPRQPDSSRELIKKDSISQLENNIKKEYVLPIQVDISQGVDYIIQRSKELKELIECDGYKTSNFLKNNSHFRFAFQDFLVSLIRSKEMNSDFKNLSKKTFEKVEKFVMKRIEQQKEKEELENKYKQQLKQIESDIRRRMNEIQQEIISQ